MRKFLKTALDYLKRNLTIVIILFIFLFLYICDNTSIKAGNFIIQNLKSIATSFTPTTDLFDDGSEISFVSYFFGMQSSGQKQDDDVKFLLPSNMVEDFDEGKTYITVSGIVYPLCAGRVVEVGYNQDGQKYIKVEHANNYYSVYVGLTNIGASMGDCVNISSPIGIGENKVNIFVENKNDLLKLSEIIWKN